MIWTQAKAVTVLAAVGTSAQGFLASLSEQLAAWVPAATTTTTTTLSGTVQIGSPPIGGPGTPGDGGKPLGTMIISWSTQHFTVTTGMAGGSLGYGGTMTDSGSMVMPTPTGDGDSSQQPSGAGDPASGGGTAGFSGDENSQTGTINTNDGSIPPVLTEGSGPSAASTSMALASGTAADGFSSGGPTRPGSTADEDEVMASILAGGLDLSEQASLLGATVGGGAFTDGSFGGGSTRPSSSAVDDEVMASILAGSPDNSQEASVPGATAGGTDTDGLSGGVPQPGSTIADDGGMASIFAGSLGTPQASVLGATAGGTITDEISGEGSQPSSHADDEAALG